MEEGKLSWKTWNVLWRWVLGAFDMWKTAPSQAQAQAGWFCGKQQGALRGWPAWGLGGRVLPRKQIAATKKGPFLLLCFCRFSGMQSHGAFWLSLGQKVKNSCYSLWSITEAQGSVSTESQNAMLSQDTVEWDVTDEGREPDPLSCLQAGGIWNLLWGSCLVPWPCSCSCTLGPCLGQAWHPYPGKTKQQTSLGLSDKGICAVRSGACPQSCPWGQNS